MPVDLRRSRRAAARGKSAGAIWKVVADEDARVALRGKHHSTGFRAGLTLAASARREIERETRE